MIKTEKAQILFAMKIIRKILFFLFLIFLALVLVGVGYYLAVTKNVSLSPEKLVLNEKSVIIYDENGDSIQNTATFLPQQTVLIQDIPQHTKQAFVNTEDRRFYKHGGFDIRRIIRAGLNNIKAGSFKEGASTISQQLIKNTHLSQEKTVKRKLREWKLTRQLEKRYEKDEILEKYLNTIYFGHSCFGIKSATEFYFGKAPTELSLAESAILAGLVKSPNNYSPFKNPTRCARRKESVLNAMQKYGHITAEEKELALAEPLPQPVYSKGNEGYIGCVFDELGVIAERHGFTLGGSIEISTYLDQNLQAELERLSKDIPECDKAFFVLNKENHGFKGCVSSVGNIQRLPGSLLKPLLVYTPALEETLLSPATPILDERVNYGGYSPENYNGKLYGYISTRECVEKSLNIPAVKTLDALGIDKATGYLEKLGLPVADEDKSLALALGGMKKGYSLRDITAAYSALQNGGSIENCGFISKVKINGATVYQKQAKPVRVFSEDSCYLMTDILKSTAKNGTAKKLRSLPFDIAAKTGTVGTDNGNTDAYALSYTTRDCVSVWLGNADNTPISHTGGGAPCNLLLAINEYLYANYTNAGSRIEPFSQPETVAYADLDKTAYYDTHTLMLADDIAPASYRLRELFKISAIPLSKSDCFTNPSIINPDIQLSDNKVIILFDKRCPAFYTYKIDRYDYATHNTVYFGEYIERFIDEEISGDKNYIYTVTPIYGEREGKTVTLPTVSTKKGEVPQREEHAIIGKEWWEY